MSNQIDHMALYQNLLEHMGDAQGQILRASEAAHVLCGQNPLGLPFAYAFPRYQGEGVALRQAWRCSRMMTTSMRSLAC